MLNFRIYVDVDGWQLYSLKHDLYETKREVGKLIKKGKRVLIIQHDTELNQDELITTKELIKK